MSEPDLTYMDSPVQPEQPSTLGMWGMFLAGFAVVLGGISGWFFGKVALTQTSTISGAGFGLIFAGLLGWAGLIVSIVAVVRNSGRNHGIAGICLAALGPAVTVGAMLLMMARQVTG